MGIISPLVNKRFSASVGHISNSDSASVGHAGQLVGHTMISRPLPSLSVLDFGCYTWYCVPTLRRLALVIGENLFACSFLLEGRSPPTRVPVVQAMVSTALPITESIYGCPVSFEQAQIF